jgi:hypothetical protein
MKKPQIKKANKVISECLDLLGKAKLSREEMVLVLGQLMIRVGYSIHFNHEAKGSERPKQMNMELASKMYFERLTTGTTLMKIGFDLQDVLLVKEKKRE